MKKKKKALNPIPPAGMRADRRRRDTRAPLASEESLRDEIKWREEHSQ